MSLDTTPYYIRSSKEGFRERKPLEDQQQTEQCYWMQEDEENEINYAKLKEKAHDRETWLH